MEQQITRIAANPSTVLCRCFCRDFVALTGAGLAASATTSPDHQDQERDND